MAQCKAFNCPDDEVPEEFCFCWVHWQILPYRYQRALCLSYGTPHWDGALRACIKELRSIEGLLAS